MFNFLFFNLQRKKNRCRFSFLKYFIKINTGNIFNPFREISTKFLLLISMLCSKASARASGAPYLGENGNLSML